MLMALKKALYVNIRKSLEETAIFARKEPRKSRRNYRLRVKMKLSPNYWNYAGTWDLSVQPAWKQFWISHP